MKNAKELPTHVEEIDHLRFQLVNAQKQIAALQAELVESKLSAKYGDNISYDPASLEIRRPSAETNPKK